MSLLGLLWWASLAMGAASLLWMTWLIAARMVRARADRRLAKDQAFVRRCFLEIMEGRREAARLLRAPARRARLIAEAILDIAGLVRGQERDRLIAALSDLGVESRLQRRLTRGSRSGRVAAAEALAIFGAPQGAVILKQAMAASRDPDFRVAALNALLSFDEAPTLRELLSEVAAGGLQQSLLYESVIRTIVARDPAGAIELFGDPQTPLVSRTLIAEALGRAGDYRAVPVLMHAVVDADLELRIACIRALGLLAHPVGAPAIATALGDEAWEVRAAAAEAAGRIGLIELAPSLVEALADDAWWVRFRAGEALAACGEKGMAVLRLAAGVNQDVVRRAASLVLAERGVAP
ncbi:MAG: HEAT repeat domain-containing protein [Brevundimonas sp.]|nr:HEAT repeat domain-containing protein [Brevundimonas sp.]